MAPIRKGDGTGLAATGYSQVRKGDGTVIWNAIPDSEDLQARYDATEISAADGDAISTWPDETGNGHDLTAGTSPTFRTDIINGNPVVRFDGVDDFLDVAFSELSQPNHIFIVYQVSSDWDGTAIYDGESSGGRHSFSESNGNWRIFAGSSLEDGAIDTNPHIHGALFNGTSSTQRLDGDETASGDTGTDGMNGYTVGANYNQGSYSEVDIGEILIYDADKSSVATDVEEYLDDKWDITI